MEDEPGGPAGLMEPEEELLARHGGVGVEPSENVSERRIRRIIMGTRFRENRNYEGPDASGDQQAPHSRWKRSSETSLSKTWTDTSIRSSSKPAWFDPGYGGPPGLEMVEDLTLSLWMTSKAERRPSTKEELEALAERMAKEMACLPGEDLREVVTRLLQVPASTENQKAPCIGPLLMRIFRRFRRRRRSRWKGQDPSRGYRPVAIWLLGLPSPEVALPATSPLHRGHRWRRALHWRSSRSLRFHLTACSRPAWIRCSRNCGRWIASPP